jgi:Holliday junction resolvasome RuvABC endonuclease subunit
MCFYLLHVYSERDRFRTKDDTFQKQLQTLRSDIERLSRIVDTVETLVKQDWPKKYVVNQTFVLLHNHTTLVKITQ